MIKCDKCGKDSSEVDDKFFNTTFTSDGKYYSNTRVDPILCMKCLMESDFNKLQSAVRIEET